MNLKGIKDSKGYSYFFSAEIKTITENSLLKGNIMNLTFSKFEKAEKIIKEHGSKEFGNVADYWFNNRDVLAPIIDNKFPYLSQNFGLYIRWKSDLGIACTKAVREFIYKAQKDHLAFKNSLLKKDPSIIYNSDIFQKKQVINLDIFSFNFQGIDYTLENFVRSFESNPQVYNCFDLQAIDLSNIVIDNCIFESCFFAMANFSNSRLQNVTFNNCIMGNILFNNSHLIIELTGETRISGSNVTGAYTIIEGLNNKSLLEPLIYNEVSYLWLIRSYFSSKFFQDSKKQSHTHFYLDLTEVSLPATKPFREYIFWYRFVTGKIANFKTLSPSAKLSFSLSLILTKCLSSYLVVSVTVLVINLFFALIFFFNNESFEHLTKDFIHCLYYSIVTFTTLGYGDIFPNKPWSRIIIMLEVILGYFFLAIYVLIIGNKVNSRY
jgi:uncharacterized protein YjbI with pentapeptide repeats